MKKVVSCTFNIDTASVEVKYADGSMISIYCRQLNREQDRHSGAAARPPDSTQKAIESNPYLPFI